MKQNIVKELSTKNEFLIGLYVGAWCGDGTQYLDRGYRIKICCHSDDKELIKFIQELLLKLFNKKTHILYEKRHRASVRFNSKFIYKFIHNYVEFTGIKTHSIGLKNEINEYTDEFLKGFLLGALLTDGYLKDRFRFNVTSKKFAENIFQILQKFGFMPRYYIQKRELQGWKDLHAVYLLKEESRILRNKLDIILSELGYYQGFLKLKYMKNGPGEI